MLSFVIKYLCSDTKKKKGTLVQILRFFILVSSKEFSFEFEGLLELNSLKF